MIKGKRKFREAFGRDENTAANYFQQHFGETLDPTVARTLVPLTNEPERIFLVGLRM